MNTDGFTSQLVFDYKLDYKECRYKDKEIQYFLSEVLKTFKFLPSKYVVRIDFDKEDNEAVSFLKPSEQFTDVQLLLVNTGWGDFTLNKNEIKSRVRFGSEKDGLIHSYKIKDRDDDSHAHSYGG